MNRVRKHTLYKKGGLDCAVHKANDILQRRVISEKDRMKQTRHKRISKQANLDNRGLYIHAKQQRCQGRAVKTSAMESDNE